MTLGIQERLRIGLSGVCLLALAGCQQLSLARAVAGYERTLDTYAQIDSTVTDVTNTRHANGREAGLISAFFGLDSALPKRNTDRVACVGAGGADGMPVIFTDQVDIKTLEPGDFRVTTASGTIGKVTCLTLAPADDPGELRTALLGGEYGSIDDQPVSVEIVGNVLSLDGKVNFKGARVAVTPLEDGPTLVWAEIVPESDWELGKPATRLPWGGGSRCPVGTKQVVRVTWGGGVTKPAGGSAGEAEGARYKVTTQGADGSVTSGSPFALADLDDGDNNHLLCLDTTDTVSAVSFPAGHLVDPRKDLNPATSYSLVKN
jgi:hypothetical protein